MTHRTLEEIQILINSLGVNPGNSWAGESETLHHNEPSGWTLAQPSGEAIRHKTLNTREAKAWLTENGYAETAATIKNLPGRPPLGKKIETRLDQNTLKAVDALAELHGTTRAQELRRIITTNPQVAAQLTAKPST